MENFEGEEFSDLEETRRSIQDLKTSFFQTLFGWTNESGVLSFTSLSDLINRFSFYSF